MKSTNRFIVQNSLSNIKDTKNFIIINVVNYYYYQSNEMCESNIQLFTPFFFNFNLNISF